MSSHTDGRNKLIIDFWNFPFPDWSINFVSELLNEVNKIISVNFKETFLKNFIAYFGFAPDK